MRKFLLDAAGILCLSLLGLQGYAVEIQIRGNPELPVKNLVQNPGMEKGEKGQPAHWRFSTAIPDNFETGWRKGGRSGKALWVKAKSGKMSGYWNQRVAVQPGKSYLLIGHYRLIGGRILCYVHARKRVAEGRTVDVDARFYKGSLRGHWLSPVFLPPEALAGPDPKKWNEFRLPVDIPKEMDAVEISLGMYFTPGEAFFDDIWFGLAKTNLSIEVHAKPQETVERVTVRKLGETKPIYEKTSWPARQEVYRFDLPNQPTTATYHVEVRLKSGEVVARDYPDRKKIGGDTK